MEMITGLQNAVYKPECLMDSSLTDICRSLTEELLCSNESSDSTSYKILVCMLKTYLILHEDTMKLMMCGVKKRMTYDLFIHFYLHDGQFKSMFEEVLEGFDTDTMRMPIISYHLERGCRCVNIIRRVVEEILNNGISFGGVLFLTLYVKLRNGEDYMEYTSKVQTEGITYLKNYIGVDTLGLADYKFLQDTTTLGELKILEQSIIEWVNDNIKEAV